ncbi:MAG: cytochrome c maturation protein CcmE [Myxococcales bacterium]|nr:cytochrome c maturation protein CcmE [Myxococcales bacterium]
MEAETTTLQPAVVPPVGVGPTADSLKLRKKASWAPVLIVALVIAIGLAVVGTSTSGGAGMYNYTLAQLATQQSEIGQREIKVAGKVAKGSVRGEPGGKDFRFDLEDGQGHRVAVAYTRLLPDPFEEGREAIVQGRLDNGVIMASNLTVKCPSRYADAQNMSEADQQKYYQKEYQKHKAANTPIKAEAAP